MADSTILPPSQLRSPWAKYQGLSRTQFNKIDWRKEMDLQQFVANCHEEELCFVRKYRGNPVPVPCRKHAAGTDLMWRAWHRRREIAVEEAEQEAKAVADRARAENPDLYRLDKLWVPLEPGVAIIRGDLLLDVATFFGDCDIHVQEQNEPITNHEMTSKGWEIIRFAEREDVRHFTHSHRQVRVFIEKFHRPPGMGGLEHPGEAALCGMKGAHGNAVCRLILFLGSTGDRESGKVDQKCSYWFYSAWGLPAQGFSKLGDAPFRMVRLPSAPGPDISEIMMRFDIETGSKTIKSFRENFTKNVKPWRIIPISYEDFRWGDSQYVDPESSEEDSFDQDDASSEDEDVQEEHLQEEHFYEEHVQEDNVQEDNVQEDNVQEDNPQDNNPQHENAQDDGSEISNLSDLSDMFREEKEGSQGQMSTGNVSQEEQGPQDESRNGTAPEEEAETVIQSINAVVSDEPSSEDGEPQDGSRRVTRSQAARQPKKAAHEHRLQEEQWKTKRGAVKARRQEMMGLVPERGEGCGAENQPVTSISSDEDSDVIYISKVIHTTQAGSSRPLIPEKEKKSEDEYRRGTSHFIPKFFRTGGKR